MGERAITSMDDLMAAVNGEFLDNDETSTPAEKVEVPIEAEDKEVVVEETVEEVVEPKVEYTPNLTYKVKDKEMKFDDRLVGLIKTKEDEDFVRDLHTRAGGLDSYKEKLAEESRRRDELEQQYAENQKQIEQSHNFYKELLSDREAKNLRGMAKKLGISEQDFLATALEIAAELEMPESQRKIVQDNRINAENVRALQQQKQTTESLLQQLLHQNQEESIQRKTQELVDRQTRELNDGISTKYKDLNDQLKKLEINLFDEVVAVGKVMYDARGGKDVSVQEALDEAAKKYTRLVSSIPKTQPIPERKGTIPNIHGTGGSPVANKEPASFDDIRKELEKIQNNK
jgi:hypothetical protein